VIFDCDGVLVDSERIAHRVLSEHATAAGVPMTAAAARAAYQGWHRHEIVASLETRLGDTLPDDWWERHDDARMEAFRRELRPVANIAVALEALAAAVVEVCVASQARLEKTRLTRQMTGLESYFPDYARFSADQVARPKPAPDLFLFAARSLGHAPEACVVVEDSPLGTAAAVQARMTVFGYARDGQSEALKLAGAHVFRDMAELPDLLSIHVP
jgi:HAD superfamily hydrolase (TIGR01509 family)